MSNYKTIFGTKGNRKATGMRNKESELYIPVYWINHLKNFASKRQKSEISLPMLHQFKTLFQENESNKLGRDILKKIPLMLVIPSNIIEDIAQQHKRGKDQVNTRNNLEI